MKFEHLLYEIILENIELGEQRKPMTQDEFESKAHSVHDAKRIEQGKKPYTYENVNYVNNKTKVFITCHEKDEDGIEHGVFSQPPNMHLYGQGCRKCSGNEKSNTDEFIQKAKKVHDTKRIEQGIKPYTYENVNYVNSMADVLITCPEHGVFSQRPNTHLNGKGCKKCGGKEKSNTDEFIQKAHKIHDEKRIKRGMELYNYSKVNYVNNQTKVDIICDKHGTFSVTPTEHLYGGSGCRNCFYESIRKNTDEFITQARGKHDEKRKINGKSPYDYSEVNYFNSRTKVIIICDEKYANGEKHGPFLQQPANHLIGRGCPICNELKGETDIKLILSKNNIEFTPQYQYEDCTSFKKSSKNKICKLLSFDFYLPKFKTLIEFDGFYHFNKKYGTNNDFMSQVLNDREKNNYTKFNDIKLIRISYFDMKNLEEEIRNGLLSKDQLYLSKSYGKHKTGWVDDNFQPTTKFLKTYNGVD